MQETLIDEMDVQWRSNSYHQLGALYSDQGKMKEAEDMYLRALAGREKAWGMEPKQLLNRSHLKTVKASEMLSEWKDDW